MKNAKFKIDTIITKEEMIILNGAFSTYLIALMYAGSTDIATDIMILSEKILENLILIED